MDSCNTCVFFHRVSCSAGECRKHPPTVSANEPYGIFVKMNSIDWCGEYVGNTLPLTDEEIELVGIISIKPTPYRKAGRQ